jgi:hypothetical protein
MLYMVSCGASCYYLKKLHGLLHCSTWSPVLTCCHVVLSGLMWCFVPLHASCRRRLQRGASWCLVLPYTATWHHLMLHGTTRLTNTEFKWQQHRQWFSLRETVFSIRGKVFSIRGKVFSIRGTCSVPGVPCQYPECPVQYMAYSVSGVPCLLSGVPCSEFWVPCSVTRDYSNTHLIYGISSAKNKITIQIFLDYSTDSSEKIYLELYLTIST